MGYLGEAAAYFDSRPRLVACGFWGEEDKSLNTRAKMLDGRLQTGEGSSRQTWEGGKKDDERQAAMEGVALCA